MEFDRTVKVEEIAERIEKIIDHTLLKPDATLNEISNLCNEAKQYGFYSVCVNPAYVSYCIEELKDTYIPVISVVGFPLGSNTIRTKVFETEELISKGVQEIDTVINIGMLKSRNYNYVLDEIRSVVEAAKGHIVKVIIETALLTQKEKTKACEIAQDSSAHFVKTSTGFSKWGATVEDVRLMREVVGNTMGVKASGGIRTYQDAIKMVEAGANRIGTSSGVQIFREKKC